MYQKRQQVHDKVIVEMKDKMSEINVNIEVKIRIESEIVKKAFENLELDVEKTARSIRIDKDNVIKHVC